MGEKFDIAKVKIISPRGRLSFPALIEAKSYEGSDPKFGGTLLVPKKTSLTLPIKRKDGTTKSLSIVTALMNAAEAKWGPKAAEMVARFKKAPKGWPVRDGDGKPDLTGYPGSWTIAATCKPDKPPGFVNAKREPIEASELYAGCWVQFSMIACAYENKWGKGLTFSLQNVQFLEHGEKFSGKKDAEDDFEEEEVSGDEPANYEPETAEAEFSEEEGF